MTGPNHHFWAGGVTSEYEKIRTCQQYQDWRQAVRVRDNWTCQACGTRGGEIHVDHVKPFAEILRENRIASLPDALNCGELWDTKNGRVLCLACHHRTPTYGARQKNRSADALLSEHL